jgi:hypothetical protein
VLFFKENKSHTIMKKYTLLLILFIGSSVFAQEKMNAYKYVVIPSRFDFQKVSDEYGINTLLKFKFQELGFTTYLDSEDIPRGLKTNLCAYITPNLKHSSTFFNTKISIEMLDCDENILFETREGKSKSKSYRVSNIEALRRALKSFNGYQLKFNPIIENVIEKEEIVVAQGNSNTVSKPVAVLPVNSSNLKFLYNGDQILFDTTNQLFYAEIKNVDTNELLGKVSKTSKSGIFHVFLDSKNGVGYYDETGNFIVEFLEEDGTVTLHRFQLLN